MVYVHDGCVGNGGYLVVHHAALHGFVEALDGIAQVGGLYEVLQGLALLGTRLLVEDDHVELYPEEAVGGGVLRLENLCEAGFLDVADFVYSRHKGCHLFEDAAFGLCEVQGFDEVGF